METDKTQPAADAGAMPSMAARGTSLGRYMVLERVGSGAMGVVYAAYDPQLDRKIALKVLRPDAWKDDSAGRSMLLREAKVMARLSHPNVVSVFDAGEADGQVFVAMEFVDGKTLKDWLAEESRSWREALAAFVEAGRGLAAAHHAGVVHRDFKPDNVLIDREGRIRVTDFGLARPTGAGSASAVGSGDNHATVGLAGTPLYMSPEAFGARTVDHRSDQFGFCVALYTALFGEPPFEGDTFEALAFSVTMGRRRPVPRTGVPSRVRRAIERGLSVKPEDRFESMDTLLASLSRRRTSWLLWTTPVAAVAATAITLSVTDEQRDPPCEDSVARLAQVWNAERRAALRDAMIATKLPFADFTVQKVLESLDAYAADWSRVRREACVATRVRHEAPESDWAAKQQCLDNRLGALDVLTKQLSVVDKTNITRAQLSVLMLPPVAKCARIEDISATGELDAVTVDRTRAAAVRMLVDQARGQVVDGQYEACIATAKRAAEEAKRLGAVAAEAEALYLHGVAEQRLRRFADAEQRFLEAAQVADTRGADALRARAYTKLVTLFGNDTARFADARRYDAMARAVLARMKAQGAVVDDYVSELGSARGTTLLAEGRADDAIVEYEAAIAARKNVPSDYAVATLYNNLAYAHVLRGDPVSALAAQDVALTLRRSLFGAEHPDVQQSQAGVMSALLQLGRFEEAARIARDVVEISIRRFGDSNLAVAHPLSVLAEGLVWSDADEAVRHAKRAVELCETARSDRDLPYAYATLARVLRQAGDHRGSAAAWEQSLAAAEKAFGKVHPTAMAAHAGLGDVLRMLGDTTAAIRHYQAALDIRTTEKASSAAVDIDVLSGLGQLLIRSGKPDEGRALLERAIAIKPRPIDLPALAAARFALAELRLREGAKADALREATTARDELRAWKRDPDAIARIESWLAAHRDG